MTKKDREQFIWDAAFVNASSVTLAMPPGTFLYGRPRDPGCFADETLDRYRRAVEEREREATRKRKQDAHERKEERNRKRKPLPPTGRQH